ncbi:hypothetical protein PLANTIT3_30201 [Plantibacter sp. T3]|nr:hypothetical protein PLANTIT3_30201 [Plantibacter sp. T3]
MAGELSVERRAAFVESGEHDPLAVCGVLLLHGVEDGDARGVPDLRGGEVDDDFRRIGGVVELLDQVVATAEEQGADDAVADGGGVVREDPADADHVGHAPREEHHREDGSCSDADREVVCDDDHRDGHHHHDRLGDRHPSQGRRAHAVPVDGLDGDDHHHGGQRDHRDLRHHRAERGHEQQEEDAGDECGDPRPSSAQFDVHDRLTDHRAAGDPAVPTGQDVGDAEGPRLTPLRRGRVGDVVDEFRREEGLHEPHERDAQRGRPDDAERLEVQRHEQRGQAGEAAGDVALVADGRHGGVRDHRDRGDDDDGDERRRHRGGELGEQQDDQHRDDEQRVDEPRDAEQVGDLGDEDEDAERVDEPDHHRAGDEPHEPGETGDAEHDLDEAREDDGGEQVLHAVFLDERRDDEGDGSRGGRDHRRTPAEDRHRDGEHDGGDEADLRVDAGDDREGDDLGDERQRRHDPGEDLDTEGPGVPQGRDDARARADGGAHGGVGLTHRASLGSFATQDAPGESLLVPQGRVATCDDRPEL